jgi:hypothetical protein
MLPEGPLYSARFPKGPNDGFRLLALHHLNDRRQRNCFRIRESLKQSRDAKEMVTVPVRYVDGR